MSKDTPDTSSISFTALYTGHVWYANGMSDPAFHNAGGSVLYHALMPFEFISKQLAGGNIKTFLLQRHHIIDHQLEQAIEKEGVTQVLEIACGMSPRGTRFCRQHPHLKYVEADLPGMAASKHRLLTRQNEISDRHLVVPLNIFSETGTDAMSSVITNSFDTSKPLLVITEGLVNYFPLEVISAFWERLATALNQFPGGIYLSDNYPMFHDHPVYRTMSVLKRMLGAVSRSKVSFHFGSDEECTRHFTGLGFDSVAIHNPKDFYGQLPIPESRGNPFVRVVEARTKK